MLRLATTALVSLLLITPQSVLGEENLPPPYKLSDLQVKLFYAESGNFSPDLTKDKQLSLWNTIIGEGSAKEASNSTIVIIEVTGKPGSYAPKRKVEIEAKYMASKEVFVKKSQDLGVFSDKGKYYVAAFLYDTGCSPVLIKATLLGQGETSIKSYSIPFECGE